MIESAADRFGSVGFQGKALEPRQEFLGIEQRPAHVFYNGTFFDLDEDGEIIIGNYCTLVGAVIATNGRVSIGDYSFLAHEVTIADHFAAVPPAAAEQLDRHGGEITIGPMHGLVLAPFFYRELTLEKAQS
jgi:hypothetical protein